MRIDRGITQREETGERQANAGRASGVVRGCPEEFGPVQRRYRLLETRSPPRGGAELIQPWVHVADYSPWAVDGVSRGLACHLAAATQPDSPTRALQGRDSNRGNARLRFSARVGRSI